MRLIHMTDVHFLGPVGPRDLLGKRLMGLTNLYALGRKGHFDAAGVVDGAVRDALEQGGELFVMTGDVTALATEAEFAMARRAFQPMIDALPSVFVPGNHDAYTRGSRRAARMERHFGDVMRGGRWDERRRAWVGGGEAGAVPWPVRFSIGDLDVVATNPCRPGLRATGRYPDGAIEGAEALVEEARVADRQVVYLTHYPPLWSDGRPYDRSGHHLVNNPELLASLRRAPPDLVLHGHNHSCWRTDLETPTGPVPVVNCGTSSAVSPLADRTAGYFVYELDGCALSTIRRRILKAGSESWEDHPGDFAPAV